MPSGSAPDHALILISANAAMIGWYAGILSLVLRSRFAPALWALGCFYLWLHVAIVFHLKHSWSHHNAYEHTREVSGVGSGVYVNYAIMLVWLIDAVWLLVADRPKIWRIAVHAFLVFMVFNGMVTYGSWYSRSLFGLFVIVSVAVWLDTRTSRLPEPPASE